MKSAIYTGFLGLLFPFFALSLQANDRILANGEFTYGGMTFCISAFPSLPVSHPNGGTNGTYSYTPLTPNGILALDTATGTLNLTLSSPGTYLITNTIAPTAADPQGDVYSVVIEIAPTPNAEFTYTQTAYCKSGNNPVLEHNFGGKDGIYHYTSQNGGILFLDSLTGAIDMSLSSPDIYTISNTVAAVNGCVSNTFSQTITLSAPADAEFAYDASAYCKAGNNPILSHQTGTNGIYSFTVLSGGPALNLNGFTGDIQLSSSDFGTYEITNFLPANGACPAAVHTETLVIENQADAEFHYDQAVYCGLDIPLILHTSGINGAYTYTVVTGGPTLLLQPNTGSIDLNFTDNGTYEVTNIVEGQGICPADTHSVLVTYANVPQAGISPAGAYDLCFFDSLTLTASGGVYYIWLNYTLPTGNVGDSLTVSEPGNYSVISYNDYGCSDTSEIVSLYRQTFPDANIITGPSLLCPGQITTLLAQGNGTSFQWLHNNDTIAGAVGQAITIHEGGFYTFVAANACGADSSFVPISESEGAVADFFVEGAKIYAGIEADFRDQSLHGYQWQWDFAGLGNSNLQNPAFTFAQTGTYAVTAIVNDIFGCRDTITHLVEVVKLAPDDVFVPNVFSPNGDGFFDVLQVDATGLRSYHLSIYDRWGNLVFDAQSPAKQWEGTNLHGLSCNQGVYFYILDGMDGLDNRIGQKGDILLIR